MNFLEKADGRDTEKYNNEIQQGTDVSQAERKERIGGGGGETAVNVCGMTVPFLKLMLTTQQTEKYLSVKDFS